MFYRLRPPAELMWIDMSGIDDEFVVEHDVDLDKLDGWKPTEDRVFSQDLLRVALRYGHRTSSGLAVRATHTVDLGRAAELGRLANEGTALQRNLRDSPTGRLLEKLMPGWGEHSEELDRGARGSMEESAQEAEADLSEMLAAPIKPELAAHWSSLGGRLPN